MSKLFSLDLVTLCVLCLTYTTKHDMTTLLSHCFGAIQMPSQTRRKHHIFSFFFFYFFASKTKQTCSLNTSYSIFYNPWNTPWPSLDYITSWIICPLLPNLDVTILSCPQSQPTSMHARNQPNFLFPFGETYASVQSKIISKPYLSSPI